MFWLGLAVVMAAAAWGSDAADTKVGDWTKVKSTVTAAGMPALRTTTTLTQVKAIENGIVLLGTTTTVRIPGTDQPLVIPLDFSISLERLNSDDGIRFSNGASDKEKWEVVEEGERTVEVDGVTFEGVFYQKKKVTRAAQGDQPGLEWVEELWDDAKAPFALARALKRTTPGMATTPQGPVEIVRTRERVAYGRAGDPIPED